MKNMHKRCEGKKLFSDRAGFRYSVKETMTMRPVYKTFLVMGAAMSLFSALMYVLTTNPVNPAWFSRWGLAVICVGFLYLGEKK